MNTRSSARLFLLELFCIFTCSFVNIVNAHSTTLLLLAKTKIDLNELDDFIIYRITSYIIATPLLVMVHQIFPIAKIAFTSCIIYAFTLVYLLTGVDGISIIPYFVFSGIVRLILLISVFAMYFEKAKKNTKESLLFLPIAICAAYIFAGFYTELLIPDQSYIYAFERIIAINALLLGGVLYLIFISKSFKEKKQIDYMLDVSTLVRSNKFELAFSFVAFYLVSTIFNSHGKYDIFDGFALIMHNNYAMTLFLLILVPPYYLFIKNIKKYQPYKFVIFAFFLLFIGFISLHFWGGVEYINVLLWAVLLVLLLITIILVLWILLEKFVETDFPSVLFLFLLSGSFGAYAGYCVSFRLDENLTEQEMITSLSTISLAFVVYAYINFIKRGLHNWVTS